MTTNKDVCIVIPARYASSRLPGKPLIKIAGKEMILRVAEIAKHICNDNINCSYVIATDNYKIIEFCQSHNLNAVMTSEKCTNGTERCMDAISKLQITPKLIVNLQGDNPLCPPWVIQSLINDWHSYDASVYTPYVHLSWEEYELLKESKRITPYSGTTVLVDKKGYALAFSKNIIPTIRNIENAVNNLPKSPIRKHIGLYAYTYDTLANYLTLDTPEYELPYIEGLEQMRFLYNGLKIKMVEVDYRNRETASGVDSPEDIEKAEDIIHRYGEFTFNH